MYKADDIDGLSKLIDECYSSRDLLNELSKNSIIVAKELFARDKNYNDLIIIYNEVIKNG